MKKVIINFILLCQLAVNGSAYASNEEDTLEKGSVEQIQHALPVDPFLRAEYLFHAGNFYGAKPIYHEYLYKNPSDKKSHQVLFRLGSIDQSIKSYSTAISFYQILLQKF